MKKIFALLIVIPLLFAACQKTPEEEVVVGKGQDQIEAMLEKAIDTPQPSSGEQQLIELQYDAPEKLEYSFESSIEGAAMKIRVNAEVVLPQYTLPIVSVMPKDLTYEDVSSVIGLFQNGRPMFNRQYAEQFILKKDIQHRIDTYMWEIAMCEGNPDAKETAEQYQKLINELYKELDTAPETYEEAYLQNENNKGSQPQEKADPNASPTPGATAVLGLAQEYVGQVQITPENFNLNSYSLMLGTGYDADTFNFNAINNTTGYPNILYRRLIFDGVRTKSIRAKHIEGIMDGFALSQQDAMETADKYANAVDDSLVLCGSSEAVYTDFSKDDNPSYPYGYTFCYSRQYNGVSVNYAQGFTLNNDLMAATGETGAYQMPYPQEYLVVTVGEDGIQSLEYSCPSEVTKSMASSVELLPFDKIKEKFEQYIALNSYPEKQTIYLDIEKIQLGLMRIAQPGSEEYLVVPVWDFYGASILSSERTEYTDEEYWSMITHFFGRSFLTINAIDGSIIDRELGY